MLDAIDRVGRLFMAKGWIVGLLLVALTVGLGTLGFRETSWDDGSRLGFGDALYKAISLLAIQTGAVPTRGAPLLEIARWLGMLFWGSAVLALVVRLSRESVHRLLVRTLASDHVIVAGLGEHGVRLVEALRGEGRTVVVVEPDRDHPAVEACRRAGAIVLVGLIHDARMLAAAGLGRATPVLALFGDEREGLRAATTASQARGPARGGSLDRRVRFVLRLTEPGLLEVIRRHKIQAETNPRFELVILNSHEIAATAMVREAEETSPTGSLSKVMILGLGSHHRLGEMVVLRLAKDRRIKTLDRAVPPLEVDIYDADAAAWLATFRSRYPFADRVCKFETHSCWARKVGSLGLEHDYDAAFVCIADEAAATAQAVMLRSEVLPADRPIMVRVRHGRSGYGELLNDAELGWGDNLQAIGLEDALYDPETATDPAIELRARATHHQYRSMIRSATRRELEAGHRSARPRDRADVPWGRLHPADRAMQVAIASIQARCASGYGLAYRPGYFAQSDPIAIGCFPPAALESLAVDDHDRWCAWHRRALTCSVPNRPDGSVEAAPWWGRYTDLDDDQARLVRESIRTIPGILALADYAIEPGDPGRPPGDSPGRSEKAN